LDDIEALQARLDAIEMIKVSADCGGGCFDPTLLNMYYGRREREHLLIMNLIRMATHMVLKYKVDWRPSAPRTRPHHSCRSFTHQSSWPALDHVSASTLIRGDPLGTLAVLVELGVQVCCLLVGCVLSEVPAATTVRVDDRLVHLRTDLLLPHLWRLDWTQPRTTR
jgi:hypothetical protein